jgi:uncharacterized repeat protein (TIGR02543 family)
MTLKKFKLISIIGVLFILLISCGNNPINETTHLQTENTSNEITSIIETTDVTSNLTTEIELSTHIDTQESTTRDVFTEDITTAEHTTTSQITDMPTTIEEQTTVLSTTVVVTEAPTTIEPTTEISTTSLPTTEPVTEITTPHYVLVVFANMEGASGTTVMSGIEGNAFFLPEEPLKQGYIFDGWYMDQLFQTPFNISEYPQEDITVYVKWLKLTTISFDRMNGTSAIISIKGLPGESMSYPDDPTNPGFVFDGWYIDLTYTSPFTLTVFPDEDLTVYAKWVEEVTIQDQMITVLENEFGFTCTNNVCELQETSWRVYTFNLNSVEFILEENITDDQDPSYYKNEQLIIDENWNVDYTISESVGNTSMRLTGNILTGNYSFSRFSSTIYEEDDYYDDMVNIIQGGPYTSGIAGFLEYILETAEMTLDDLVN